MRLNEKFSLSVIVAVYNDQEVIEELYKRLLVVLNEINVQHEIIFVDDASSDNSFETLQKIQSLDSRIRLLKLTRNFGQPNAISAGLDYAQGDIIVLIDSDLQDRPEDIPKLIETLFEQNVPMAIARRKSRKDSAFKQFSSKLFFKATQNFTDLKFGSDLGVFRALRKELIDELKSIPEKTGTYLSLLYWMGIEYATVDLEREARYAGTSGYTFTKMCKLTLDRMFSYSMFPIRLATISGAFLSIFSILLGLFYLMQQFFSIVLPGWTTIVVLILFLFGINFFILGLFGEYMGRIFIESRGRPKYVIDRFKSSELWDIK
jgi:polyisoprenyl-phosphate glycosyltransferase